MNDLTAEQWAALIIAAIIVLLALRLTLNPIVFLFVPSAIRYAFEGGPEEAEELAEQAGAGDILNSVRALGFELLGLKAEYMPLWGKVRELSLASPAAGAFASLGIRGNECKALYFYTTFLDGALVLTADGAFLPVDKEDYVIAVMPGTKPGELLAIHQKQVEYLRHQGHEVNTDYSTEGRLTATGVFYAAAATRSFLRRAGLLCLVVLVFMLGLAAAIAWGGFAIDW
jgi:hypothetical protein